MAEKFHINPETGNANKCVAKPGKCRFGSDTNHYDSKDEARSAYEERMSSQVIVKSRRQLDDEEYAAQMDAERKLDEEWAAQSHLVYDFPTGSLGEAIDKIEKANRRLEKYGIKERFEYTTEERFKSVEKVGGMILSESYTKFTLNSPSIAINGNKFLAVITQEEAGFITKTGKDVELNGWRPESMACEHCGQNRPRSKTYLVEDENGGRHQIGSTCVDAYLGVKPEGLWAVGADPLDGVTFGGNSTPNPAGMNRPTDHMIAYALAVSNEGAGFVSRSSSMNTGERSTADLIETALWSNYKEDRAWREEMERKSQEYLTNGKAKEVLANIRKIEGDSDYATNLRTVAAGEYLNPSNNGLLVSGISYLRREKEQAVKDSLGKAAIGFAGQKGDKVKDKKATIIRVKDMQAHDFNGNEITKTQIGFRDENNHELIWWASKQIKVEEGTQVTFTTGSVKDHSHFNGTDQTVLTRVKFSEDENK